MPLKLLCAADLHLGRQPSRVPDELSAEGGLARLSPSAAWFALVDAALDQGVDALVLAGDVVEQSDDFYEAYADLRAGVERLSAAGIPVFGVAGNHDVKVLPRLAREVDGFELLGEGGAWESRTLRRGSESVELTGWSFSGEQVVASPLDSELPGRSVAPRIGVLHCDRDASGSRYAPVTSTQLRGADVDAWLLGHIHKPDRLSSPRPMGYLGSLAAVDPGERGEHGAWLLNIGSGGEVELQMLPLAPLRWEVLEVEVSELDDVEDVHSAILESLRGHRRELSSGTLPRAVGLRLVLAGRNRFGQALYRELERTDPRSTVQHLGGIAYFVHDWRVATRPAFDLNELAEGSDPAALLARRLLLLRGGRNPEQRQALLRKARKSLEEVPRRTNFRKLGTALPDDEELARLLAEAAARALDELLAQRRAAS